MIQIFAAIALLLSVPAQAVRWEEQVERLQNVSACLIDGIPMGDPLAFRQSVEARTVVSLLPTVNPRVGSKVEKVPSSPVHLVPMLQFNARILQGTLGLGFQGWAGYLPSGVESLLGVSAKLSQLSFGGAAVLSYTAFGIEAFLPIGIQHSRVDVTGGITEAGAADTFKVDTNVFYAAPGVRARVASPLSPRGFLWANLLIGTKTSNSEFLIPSDNTRFRFTDSPLILQPAVGFVDSSGLGIAVAELYIPDRVLMPRFLLSYQLVLAGP